MQIVNFIFYLSAMQPNAGLCINVVRVFIPWY